MTPAEFNKTFAPELMKQMTPAEFAKTFTAEWINRNVKVRILDGRPDKLLWRALEDGFCEAISMYVSATLEEKRPKTKVKG